MSWQPMKFDSEDDWPLAWPDYDTRIERCSKCCHPSSHHGLNLVKGKGRDILACNNCGCIANSEDFEDEGPVRGEAYAKR